MRFKTLKSQSINQVLRVTSIKILNWQGELDEVRSEDGEEEEEAVVENRALERLKQNAKKQKVQ